MPADNASLTFRYTELLENVHNAPEQRAAALAYLWANDPDPTDLVEILGLS